MALSAFGSQPLLPRDTFTAADIADAEEVMKLDTTRSAEFVLAWYLRQPWDEAELLREISALSYIRNPTILGIVRSMGAAGEPVLRELLTKNPEVRQYLDLLDAPSGASHNP